MHNSSPNLPPSQGCSPSGNEGVGGSKKTIEAGEGLSTHHQSCHADDFEEQGYAEVNDDAAP